MTALQNLISLAKFANHPQNSIEPPFAWTGRARIAQAKSGPLMQLIWLAIALVLVDRACAYLLGSESLLSGFVENNLVHAGNTGIYAVWAIGHCDSMDGPVITQAKRALESGNVNLVLPWVRVEDEAKIRSAFEKTLSVRKLGVQAERLADMYFFETLVRVHRAGEGAPYLGVKPAGQDLGPAIPASDKALDDGSIEAVMKLLNDKIRDGLQDKFRTVLSRRKFDPNDVAAGREYVEAYVSYIHYTEGLWHAATASVHNHHLGQDRHKHEDE